MTNDDPTLFDRYINAIGTGTFLIEDLREMSDRLSFEETTVALQSLDALTRQAKAAADAVNQQRTSLIRGAGGGGLRVGDKLYAVKPDGKWRTDWPTLRNRVLARAYVSPDGEELVADEAVSNVIDMMEKLFLSPSSTPKVGAVQDVLKLPGLNAIADWAITGDKIEVMDLGTPE